MLDPRTKLLLALFYAVFVVASGRLAWLLVEGGLLLLLVVLIGEGKAYLCWLRLVLPMALFFGAVTWWTADAETAVIAALRLLILTSTFFAFFSTTTPEDLGNSLVKVGLPYAVAFVLKTSLQFVPVIGRKARNVFDAQRARGIPLSPGWSALRHYPAFLGPLLIQSFHLAEELAEAMEARGFGRSGRTFLKEYQLQVRDWLVLAVGFLTLVAFLAWRL
jgi:energy-coupling factor transport system permease protein